MTSRSHPVTVAMSPELVDAIDAEAFALDETRSGCIRRMLTDELRDLGRMALKAPPTKQLGKHNRRYRSEGRA